MRDDILHAATVFMGFFAITNPLANLPVFLSLTRGNSAAMTRTIALRAVSMAFGIVCVFTVSGKIIFDLFGITLDAFRITGGILVFYIGIVMLQGSQSDVQQPHAEEPEQAQKAALSVAVTPLAMPIIAGPGTIATAMNFAAGGGIIEVVNTIIAFAVLAVITFYLFVRGERLVAYLGDEALSVITRMMGLLLAVIGTQMLIGGLLGAFPVLNGS